MKYLFSFFLFMCLLVSAIPSYADQYVTIEVGETKTISLPSDIAMKDIHTSNWVCTDYQYAEVINTNNYSITIKGLKGPSLPNQVWIRCDYYYYENGMSHSGTHAIRVTVLDQSGQGPDTGEELPYGDDKNIPFTGVYDYGWAGDYTVYEGNEVMVSANFNPSYVPYYSGYKWTSKASFNYRISYKGGNYCIIKGTREGTSKLYCYAISDTGNSSHLIYYNIKVIKPVDVENVTLNQDKLVLSPENTYKLEATIFPSNANVNTSIAWSSDNTSVATVDSKGNVTAKGIGTATITAKTGNGKIAKCEVTVRNPVVVSAHAGRYHSLVVKSDGSLWSSGRNDYGQLGDSKTTDRNKFVKVMDNVSSVYAGYYYSLVIKRDNSLWNFGNNSQGALGDGTSSHLYSPKKVMDNVKFCTGEYSNALYIKTDGSLWGSGYNKYGELGTGNKERVLNPKKIMDNVSSVSIQSHTLIVKKDGTLWGCGINSRGELGDGTTIDRLTPIKITDNVKSVDMGELNSFVLKNDNSLWACGGNYSGQFGLGTTGIETTLVKIMDDVYKVTSGNYRSTYAIKKDGSLWACGNNEYGQLGDGTTNSRYTFVKIMDNVRDVTTDDSSAYIIKKDNSLWSCGSNYCGKLGDGTTINRSTPVKIMDDVSTVFTYSIGYTGTGDFCLIVKNDGSLWACGKNNYGQLGDGTTTDRSTPVMIMEGDPSYAGIQDVVISDDEMPETKAQNGVFSISGQRLSTPQKGINIINGKKYVIK